MTSVADGLAAGATLHLDETGARIAGVRHWFHVASSELLTYLFCHKKRGNDAIVDAGILARFRGTAVHDCWAAYLSYGDCDHQLCGAHLLRELEAIIDDPTHERWATDMTQLLLEAKAAVAAAQASGAAALSDDTLDKLVCAYKEIVGRGLAAAPDPGSGRTWWPIDRKAYNLAKRLADRRHQVLAFTRDFSVPFTNNQAERDLRMVKLQQKISGCFRTLAGAEAFATVRSYIQTAAKQGQNIFEVLVQLVTGDPWMPNVHLSG
jgi:transposase